MPGGFEADDVLWTALSECENHEEMRAVLEAWVGANEVFWADAQPSPGGWMPPSGCRPGWDWKPPDGLLPRLSRMPLWVRACYHTPFLDRTAHEWMWHHGGFDVIPPGGSPGEATTEQAP